MEVEFNNPEFPAGTEFDVGGILLVNGELTEVGEEVLAEYEAQHGQSYKDFLSGNVHTPYYREVESTVLEDVAVTQEQNENASDGVVETESTEVGDN